ncbi:hypothetical protein AB4455_24195 [Vibrio sp. 10N.261.46.E12]|uniref:hypothetical protein n=1 Tax=unclassified Vibrio TaxID=2614977 RepID=UPI0009789AE4|nr:MULTISPECIES: hypothetical protein [unclassified Vibrio]OMO35214.1 hypothetical protein BH584_09765 [Vibrio sp. 10N.261.45.E1]PMJ25177.1 hypothetical protein BCU27_11620 [Vibrio sp. 10N.286.45.B6]PML88364.1 hypothetical protein BCT66_00460 [Vibrio sp. 10N.261.49.E11]PMM70872.1 hypothetical protein BCT48_09295 [Vibrio sp. 10N.261.46.F12]PMM80928.1 hypothetical protein BCT46_17065 [Vibrio sp. 10N.261.46.E8]
MFEPIEIDMDELQLAISLPELDSVPNGVFIPLEDILDFSSQDSNFDALFVSGLYPEQSKTLIQACAGKALELVNFENPSNDLAAIHDVVLNLVGKLFSDEMPNNIDIADIRNLNQSSDFLFAFNRKSSALDFMAAQALGVIVGGVYLAHGGTELDEYEAVNKELTNHISEYGFLCSSFYGLGRSECTILLGVKS